MALQLPFLAPDYLCKLPDFDLNLDNFVHSCPNLALSPLPMSKWVTKEYKAILSALTDAYAQSQGSDRKDIISQGVSEITAAAEKDQVAIPGGLYRVCVHSYDHLIFRSHNHLKKVQVWFQNQTQRKLGRKAKPRNLDGRCGLTWTLRRVVKEEKYEELNARILKKDPAANPGTPGYMRLVNKVLSRMIRKLSEEERVEYQKIADQRNVEGVDVELKARCVHHDLSKPCRCSKSDASQAEKYLVKAAKEFMDKAYQQMGVHVFMMLGYPNKDGEWVRFKYVLSQISAYFGGIQLMCCCQDGNRHNDARQGTVHPDIQQSWSEGMGEI
jgi:hypothetical protein